MLNFVGLSHGKYNDKLCSSELSEVVVSTTRLPQAIGRVKKLDCDSF